MAPPRRLLALDTEDDSKGHVRIINVFDGVLHRTFTGRNMRVRAWTWLASLPSSDVWACNAEYDLINVFGPWVGKLCTLQYTSAGLMRASFQDAPVTFYDTLRHWQRSVGEMGEALGLPKLEQDFRSVAYCRRDTEIVWRFVALMLGRYEALGLRPHATLPGVALELWRQHWADPCGVPDDLVAWFREGYHGGRVECYRLGDIYERTHHYDVVSLYPSVMVGASFPDVVGPWRETRRPSWEREGMADVTLQLPATEYPALPWRAPSDELCYPYGRFRGLWTYPEIRQALADGGRIERVHRAVEYRRTVAPFRTFVEQCFTARQATEDYFDRLLWKLMMNSLYGKFGSRNELEVIYKDRLHVLTTRAKHVNVIWAAYVTALARIRMVGELRAAHPVWYTDTDSLFTPTVRPTGAGLGELKLEGTAAGTTDDYTKIRGNKLYIFGAIARAKGVKPEYAADFIRTGRAVFRQPARLRQSARLAVTPNYWYRVTRELHAVYAKRKVHEDGTSEPWDAEALAVSE
jgi:hypothetical protein